MTVDISGMRKAAILLVQLGRERAAPVLAHLPDSDVEAISAEISRLESLGNEEADVVLTEFRDLARARAHITQGGPGFAQALLEETLGVERAAVIMDRVLAATVSMPLQFLHRTDPQQVVSFISGEHPQIIAVVLSHMQSEKATQVLSALDPDRQAEVAHRIAIMDSTSPATIRQLEVCLERKMSSVLQPAEMSAVGGVEPLVEIINRSDRATERLIIEGLEARDPELADQVKSRMFMFEDIVNIDDRSVQQLLRQVDAADLALSLKGVSETVRTKVTSNMSERAAEVLVEEVELLGAVRLRQVEEAQQKVIRIIRTMEEAGAIELRRGNDDEYVA